VSKTAALNRGRCAERQPSNKRLRFRSLVRDETIRVVGDCAGRDAMFEDVIDPARYQITVPRVGIDVVIAGGGEPARHAVDVTGDARISVVAAGRGIDGYLLPPEF
jgi:hypothetical protein